MVVAICGSCSCFPATRNPSIDNRSMKVGTVKLPNEPVQLTIQSEGPISGYLMDLRTILLYPE